MASTQKMKKRKQKTQDPERLRLEEAVANSTPALFLPQPNSSGVGKFEVSRLNALKALFYLVVAKVKGGGVTWGEGEDQDPRRRMYGFLPQKREELIQEGIQIQKYGADSEQEHVDALQLASVDLVFANHNNHGSAATSSVLVLDKSIWTALTAVTGKVQSLVPNEYKKYATMDQLIAVQPNLHNGASYLPAHLDFPRNDGFGVLIVTIGIRGSGVIVLIDDGEDGDDAKSFSFGLEEGEAYILCGDARNKCVHGVLCDDQSSSQRETLNLRYGLHSAQFAYDEIDQHWPD